MKSAVMKSTTEIRLFEIFRTKFSEPESKELVGEIKSLTHDDLAERIEARIAATDVRIDTKISSAESKILSSLTWRRLLLFFLAQASFTVALVKFMG